MEGNQLRMTGILKIILIYIRWLSEKFCQLSTWFVYGDIMVDFLGSRRDSRTVIFKLVET